MGVIRWGIIGLAVAGPAAVLALTAAQQPPALAAAKAGLWELEGLPGAKAPLRECISDIQKLARLEHRARNCTAKVISDDGHSTVVEYSCGAAGFGHSKVEVITPRSLKISTQGISDASPFNYTLQARRIGDCAVQASTNRH
jgi:hypothetical protein